MTDAIDPDEMHAVAARDYYRAELAAAAQRADHYEHLYAEASAGRCGHSGLALGACKGSICDCFDFPWVTPSLADDNLGETE